MSKYALLVGINYRGTRAELKGCINDVQDMKNYLLQHRGYVEANITVLTEDTEKKPTAANILHGLSTLMLRGHTNGAKELWFHYSGHGSSTRDNNGDEDDGMDETIVPLDYTRSGMITDDILHDYIEHKPVGCEMICILDCCHSGTILDLKYQYKGGSNHSIENAHSRVPSGVIMLSGCMDTQTSADAHIGNKWSGAMTCSFIQAMGKYEYHPTCYQILDGMRNYLRENHYAQYPQLSSSHEIKDDTPFP